MAPVFLVIIFDGGGKGFVTEDAAVEFVFWEAAEKFGDFVGADFEGFVHGFAFGELGEGRSGSDGAGATVGFPL